MLKTIVKSSVILSTFLQVGCGKEVINKAPASDNSVSVIRGITADSFRLRAGLNTDGTYSNSSKSFEEDLEVIIPTMMKVTEGNAGDGNASLYFNFNSDSTYSFYCKYVGVTSQENSNYVFQDCYTQENDQGQISFRPGEAVTQYSSSSVVFTVNSADPTENTQVEVDIEVDWH